MKMKKKKIIVLFLAVMMVCTIFAACDKTEPEATTNDNDTTEKTTSEATEKATAAPEEVSAPSVVNVGLPADVPSLDPFYGSSVGGNYVVPEIYQYLFSREVFSGEATPMIGKSIEVADDKLSCVITIFDNVYDSAGNHITAEDVVFSYETAFETGFFRDIKILDTIEAIDEYTVKITVTSSVINSITGVISTIFIVDSEAYDADAFTTAPIGTGPYVVEEYVSGSNITLVKNENYWQTDEAMNHPFCQQNVDEINFKIILESAQMSIALETGDIDIAGNISSNDLNFFADENGEGLDGYTVNSVNTNLFNNMAFNMSADSIMGDNLALRQAILYAIDAPSLVYGVLQSAGEPVYTWGCKLYSDYNPAWTTDGYYDYDVEKAKTLLAESGYNGEKIRIILENVETRKKAAEIMQSYLLTVGIDSEINTYDSALFQTYKYSYDQWDIILDNQANNASLANMWANFFDINRQTWKDQGTTYNGLHDENLQVLIDAMMNPETNGRGTVDAVHNYLEDNAVAIGLWAGLNYQVAQDGVEAITLNEKLFLLPGACVYEDDYTSKNP